MNREILNLKNLSVSYGDINILKDIDLSLKKGGDIRYSWREW